MNIYLQQHYSISGTIHMDDGEEYIFNLPFEGKCEIKVTDSQLKVNAVFSFEKIITDNDLEKMSPHFIKVVASNLDHMRHNAFYLINLLKYSLNNDCITEELLRVSSTEISIDNSNWYVIPPKSMLQMGPSASPRELTKETCIIVQNYIHDKIEPFVALKHLHRARKDDVPRHMWIEATIAAELAIKEFLIRLKPDMELILLELPSPHLGTLYGKVLEHYIGEKYPKSNKLADGSTIRNKLIHRPKEANITYEKAVEYVQIVEDAIYFLLRKLYPMDPIINSSGNGMTPVRHIEQ
ncbi:hypothetical protein [Priestia megaterium]|uniref:hypothetical protein n=1 Tax=Priestia megaterium TaxID=1404 RepID=UPI000D522801|nr:hypothetical protein [Priestia megaterium]PVE71158.1 hypothetical protein DC428_12035 [Priestia megaterium]PVE89213.1 hypothetical protein DC421_03880 [Priestia megaterium]PVE92903.1 hypothetical protein DC426_05535 [Priestia megaterium]PVE96303.1 hypothetical protein DC433_21680 [Priestia megaterium]